MRVALNPAVLLRDLWQHRGLIGQMALREFNQRYRASSMGTLWAIIQPLMMLAIYTFIFSMVFVQKTGEGAGASKVDFALALYSALVFFNIFSECVSRCTSSITSQANYVKKVVFPLQVIPVAITISALIMAGINLGLLFVFSLLFRHHIPATAVCTPLILLPTLMFSLGMGYFFASLGVYLRDVEHAVGIGLQVLFFMTPIFYPIVAVPEAFRGPIQLNPLSMIVESARNALLYGQWPNWGWYVAALLTSALTLQLGYAWFVKTRGGFADVL